MNRREANHAQVVELTRQVATLMECVADMQRSLSQVVEAQYTQNDTARAQNDILKTHTSGLRDLHSAVYPESGNNR